jgi:outer membrane protein TolC
MRMRTLAMSTLALALTLGASSASAQAPARARVTLDEAVARALANHPRLRSSRANERAAEARTDEARARELPALGVSAQVNRSTGNTPPGAFFPAMGFVPVAGAPRGRTIDEGAWQTGVSVWADWDVTSLARQAAAIDATLAAKGEAEQATRARELEIAYATADAFVSVLAAGESTRAAKASLDRARVFQTVVHALVAQNLRPGVDEARADSEVARAETQVARAEQNEAVRGAQLVEAMGGGAAPIEPDPGALLRPIDEVRVTSTARVEDHPLVRQRAKGVERASAQRHAVDLEFLPRIDLLASAWLRGSGYYGSAADGLAPDIPNWAAGAVATWNVLDWSTIRARARAADATREAALADRDEAALAVSSQVLAASAILEGSGRVAQSTPKALASAQTAEKQILARYQAGLAQAVDVADVERALAQADADEAVARLEVRRAALLVARAGGNLEPFFVSARASASPAGGR